MTRAWRRELWLWLSTFALDRALDNCKMPQDEETIRKIRDSTAIWLQPAVSHPAHHEPPEPDIPSEILHYGFR